jgi:hypothetical protein
MRLRRQTVSLENGAITTGSGLTCRFLWLSQAFRAGYGQRWLSHREANREADQFEYVDAALQRFVDRLKDEVSRDSGTRHW